MNDLATLYRRHDVALGELREELGTSPAMLRAVLDLESAIERVGGSVAYDDDGEVVYGERDSVIAGLRCELEGADIEMRLAERDRDWANATYWHRQATRCREQIEALGAEVYQCE